mgnify:CR=1 FL=1
MRRYFIELEDPDLAYLVEGTPEFEAYITDMLWAQRYAMANREAMMDAAPMAMRAMLERIAEAGMGSMLAVLKERGLA